MTSMMTKKTADPNTSFAIQRVRAELIVHSKNITPTTMQVPTKFTSQSQCVLALQDLQKALQPRGHYGVRMTLKILTVKSKTQLTKELSGTEMKRTCALHRLSGYPETRGRGRKLENLKATTSAH